RLARRVAPVRWPPMPPCSSISMSIAPRRDVDRPDEPARLPWPPRALDDRRDALPFVLPCIRPALLRRRVPVLLPPLLLLRLRAIAVSFWKAGPALWVQPEPTRVRSGTFQGPVVQSAASCTASPAASTSFPAPSIVLQAP